METRYITLNEFNQYFPEINLNLALGGEENALAFLKRIEDRLAVFINANFQRNIDMEYPEFTDYQKEQYKLALLEQAIYIFKNSDISVDSGYDIERGIVINRSELVKLSIAPNTQQHLIMCGIWNRQIRSNRMGRRFIGW